MQSIGYLEQSIEPAFGKAVNRPFIIIGYNGMLAKPNRQSAIKISTMSTFVILFCIFLPLTTRTLFARKMAKDFNTLNIYFVGTNNEAIQYTTNPSIRIKLKKYSLSWNDILFSLIYFFSLSPGINCQKSERIIINIEQHHPDVH